MTGDDMRKRPWELCRRLANPERLRLLRRVYNSGDGLNVGVATDDMTLGQPATSQYLLQLESLGLVRRERAGRYVNYTPDIRNANALIRPIAEMLLDHFTSGTTSLPCAYAFPALANAKRARIVHCLSVATTMTDEEVCERFNIHPRHLMRETRAILDCGLARHEGGRFVYVRPTDAIARAIIRESGV